MVSTDGRTDGRTDTEGYNIIPRHTLVAGYKNYEAIQHVQELRAHDLAYASVTFATVVVRFICLRFSLRFFGIVGSYKLRRMCLYIAYDHLTISFGDKLGQNLTETLQISYTNRKVIVQSSCYHRVIYINRTMPLR